jgi:hypothetical protein
MANNYHFSFESIDASGQPMSFTLTVDIDAVAKRLAPRIRKSKAGKAQAMHGAIVAKRKDQEGK